MSSHNWHVDCHAVVMHHCAQIAPTFYKIAVILHNLELQYACTRDFAVVLKQADSALGMLTTLKPRDYLALSPLLCSDLLGTFFNINNACVEFEHDLSRWTLRGKEEDYSTLIWSHPPEEGSLEEQVTDELSELLRLVSHAWMTMVGVRILVSKVDDPAFAEVLTKSQDLLSALIKEVADGGDRALDNEDVKTSPNRSGAYQSAMNSLRAQRGYRQGLSIDRFLDQVLTHINTEPLELRILDQNSRLQKPITQGNITTGFTIGKKFRSRTMQSKSGD